jgi:phosphatidylinositol alpha-1,6-mannosyltransferase
MPVWTSSAVDVLGLFPSLAAQIGGVEASGNLAWQGLLSLKSQFQTTNAHLFCYGRTNANALSLIPEAVSNSSKVQAIISAARLKLQVRLVLVWHVGLLKLLPFFRVPQAKVALYLHGIEAWRSQGWYTRLLLRRVNVFLTNSEYTWDRFVSFNPEFATAPHETVPLGIGSPVDTPTLCFNDPPVVLMISRLLRSENYKGHSEMIETWPSVVRRVPEAELWIAGDGDLLEDLQQMVKSHGLAHQVRFFGAISEAEKQRLLAHCRCLAMPSRSEGFGLVYLEAMRIGRPCLVSTVDAGREVVNPPEGGLAADPCNPSALTEAICRLITPGREWERWAAQARDRYENYFTGSHFQDRLLKALMDAGL